MRRKPSRPVNGSEASALGTTAEWRTKGALRIGNRDGARWAALTQLSAITTLAIALSSCSSDAQPTAPLVGNAVPIAVAPGSPAVPGVISPAVPGTPATAPAEQANPGNPTAANQATDLPGPVIDCSVRAASSALMRRITANEYHNSVRTLLGVEVPPEDLAADAPSGQFATNRGAGASSLTVNRYQATAESVAAQATSNLEALLAGQDAHDFVTNFARLAYRRALSATELESFRDAFQSAEQARDVRYAVQSGIERVLQSPFFLYFVERAGQAPAPAGMQALSGYSVAEKLASFLWESVPDEALLDAAEAGLLDTPAGVREQANRMIQDDQATEAFVSFFNQWFGVSKVQEVAKDEDLFPDFNEQTANAMRHETENFVRWMIRENNFNYTELMTSNRAFPGEALADFYNVAPTEDATPVSLEPQQRYGVVTHPSILAGNAHREQSSIVLRGVFVRERLLCQPLPEPPDDVNAELPEPIDGEELTTRQLVERHSSTPACAACHSLIDGLGFAFEHFDAVGAYRTEDGDSPIDAKGELTGLATPASFSNANELIDLVSTSPEGIRCAVTQWQRFANRRLEQPGDACSHQAATQQFVASGLDFRSLILATVESDSFRFRSTAPASVEAP